MVKVGNLNNFMVKVGNLNEETEVPRFAVQLCYCSYNILVFDLFLSWLIDWLSAQGWLSNQDKNQIKGHHLESIKEFAKFFNKDLKFG